MSILEGGNYSQEVKEIQEENSLMRKLGNKLGFFQYFFDQLPYHRTNFETFKFVNDKYYNFFGEDRYTNYNSFRNAYQNYRKFLQRKTKKFDITK